MPGNKGNQEDSYVYGPLALLANEKEILETVH